MYVYICMCIYVCVYMYVCIYMSIYVCVYMYVCMYVCVYRYLSHVYLTPDPRAVQTHKRPALPESHTAT